MEKEVVFTEKAPKPVGPYSQAIIAGPFIFVSGQIPIDPKTGVIVKGGIKEQTERTLENIKAILEAAGSSLDKVVKVTVYLRDLNLFKEFNEAYAKYFPKDPPARATIEVSNLWGEILIEIDAIALR
mgnify:CR=1 FL=1